MARVTGAQALLDCLRREGVEHIWGIPGTQNLPIIDALQHTPEIRFVLTRHEQGAGFMAYGYARASGRPAVVTATEGPGVTNLATPIAAAFKGQVPLISVCGLQEESLRERDANQDIDQMTFFRPITKWAYSIPSASKVQEAVRKAFRVALSQPRGSVHLDASRDVYLAETEAEAYPPASYRPLTLPDCRPDDLDQVLALLEGAQRPLFVVGGGIVDEDVVDAMMALADQTGIPVAALQYHPDAFPTRHPLALGLLGRNGWSSANRATPQADLLIAVGAHLDAYSTTFTYGIFSRDAKLVHQNPAASEIGTVFPVTLAVVGSTASFVEGLLSRVRRAGRRWEWLDVGELRDEWETERRALVRPSAEPVSPPFVAATIRDVLPHHGVMILDAGNAGKHMRTFADTYEPRTFMSIDDWASVGGAFPIGLGAKMARPDRPVICTVGDMGMMCNIGEMETAVRENIPIVCVVYNDQGLGNERAYQRELYGGRIYATDYRNPDFGALARAFGGYGEQVTHPTDLEPALRRALDSQKPAIIDVIIDQNTLAPVIYKG